MHLQIDINKLTEINCWRDAAVQIFYSQGATWGVLLTYASKNKFNMQIIKTTCGISVLNGLTSAFACFVVYAAIGMLSYEMDPSNPEAGIDAIGGESGQGLAFVVYPAVLSRMGDYSWIMSILFFLMLTSLGLGTLIGMVMVLVECCSEWLEYRRLNKNENFRKNSSIKEIYLLIIVILAHLALTVPLITNSGNYWLVMMNNYCGFIMMAVIAVSEYIAIGYMYGTDKFLSDISKMIGREVPFRIFWKITWQFTGPIFSFVIVYLSVESYDFKSYGGPKAGTIGNSIGLLTCLAQVFILIWFMVKVNYREFIASFKNWFNTVTTVHQQSFYSHRDSQILSSDSEQSLNLKENSRNLI